MNRYKMAMLMPIKPQLLEKVLIGEKTIDVRKIMPKCDLPIDIYLYCCKSNVPFSILPKNKQYGEGYLASGKVVAKFTLNTIDKYQIYDDWHIYGTWFKNEMPIESNKEIEMFLKQSCFSDEELCEYVGMEDIEFYQYGRKPETGYFCALHIDNLEIFNNPMDLSEFRTYCDGENNKCKKCSYYWYNSNESIGFEDGCYCNNYPSVKKVSGYFLHVLLEEQ